MKNIQQQIISILQAITNKKEIDNDSRLADDLGLTSLDMMVFICEIEKAFGCTMAVSEVMMWQTVDNVTTCLSDKIGGYKYGNCFKPM